MSASNEWWDFHLTPRGWEGGSSMVDGGKGLTEVQPPPDRVLTMRCSESVSDSHAPMYREWEEQWRSPDEQSIQALLAKHGKAEDQ